MLGNRGVRDCLIRTTPVASQAEQRQCQAEPRFLANTAFVVKHLRHLSLYSRPS